MAGIKIPISIDNTNFAAAAREAQNAVKNVSGEVKGLEKDTKDATQGIKDMLTQAAAFGGISLGFAGAKEFVQQIIDVRKEMQGYQTSLNVLLGDQAKANAMFNELKDFAVRTPLMFKDLAAGAQTMLGFNIEAEKVVPTLKAIGDISMGDSQKFQSLTLAFSQMSATGKLMGQDLLQMINAGFNPLTEIANRTGKSIAQLKDEMSAGAISAEMVADAFMSATQVGGKFHGMIEAQGKTLAGQLNTLSGAIDDMFNELGQRSDSIITGTVQGLTELVKHWEAVGDTIAIVAGTLGTYKAIETATALFGNHIENTIYEAEIKSLEVLIGVKEQEKKTDLETAVATGRITQQKAEKIAMMRLEAQQQVKLLALKQQEAQAAFNTATSEAAAALTQLKAAQERYDAIDQEYNQLIKLGKVRQADAMAEQLEAAEAELNAAAQTHAAASRKAKTAATELDAASTARSAAATKLDAVAQATDTAATSALARAKMQLAKVVQLVNKSFLASPYFWAATAIVGVVYATYKLVNAETQEEAIKRKLNETSDEYVKNQEKQTEATKKLLQVIQDSTSTDAQKITAYRELQSACKILTDKYSLEQLAVMGLSDAYKELAKSQEKERIEALRHDTELKKRVLDDMIDVQQKRKSAGSSETQAFIKQYGLAGANADEVRKMLREQIDKQQADIDAYDQAQKKVDSRKNMPYKTLAETIYADWKDAKALVDKLIKEDAAVEKVEQAKNQMDKFDKEYEELTGSKASSKSKQSKKDTAGEAKNAAKRIELERQQQIDEARAITDMENATIQARINAMEDGSEKILQQLDLDFMKEMEAIKREQEDLLAEREQNAKELYEAKGKDNIWEGSKAQQQFQQGNKLTDADNEYFKARTDAAVVAHEKGIEKQYQAERAAQIEYLKQFGDYMQQRQAIEDEYEQKKKNATTQGEKDILDAQREKDLSALDERFGQSKSKIIKLWNDVSAKSRKSIKEMIDDLGKLQKAMQDGKLTDNEKSMLAGLGFTPEDIAEVANGSKTLQDVIDRIQSLKGAATSAGNAFEKIGDAWDDVFGENGNVTPESINNLISSISAATDSVMTLVGGIGDIAGAFGNTKLKSDIEDVGTVLNSTMSMAAAGAQVGGGWGALAGAVIGLGSGLAQVFSSHSDDDYSERIKELDKRIKSLTRSYEELNKAVDRTFSSDKSLNIEREINNLSRQNALIQQQIEAENAKKKTDQSAIDAYNDQIYQNQQRIKELREAAKDAIFGEDLTSAVESFAQAYADAWANNTNRTKTAKEQVREMMQNMVRESIKAAVESSNAMERIRTKLASFYTDGILTAAEQEAIEREAELLQSELDQKFGWANDLLDKDKNYNQSGTSGGFTAMSQESADELNGRFAASQITIEGILQHSMLIYAANQQMVSVETESNETMKEIRNLVIGMASNVEDIATYTRALTTFGAKFDEMNRKLERL